MKFMLSILVLAITFPLSAADDPAHRVLASAVEESARLFSGFFPCPDNVVISSVTVRENDDVVESFLQKHHGMVIANEIVASYRDPADRRGILPDDLPLKLNTQQYAVGDRQWDWQRMNAAFPNVKAIVTLSQPAFDSLATYAVVRYEVTTRGGLNLGAFQDFERQTDGSWKAKVAQVGSIRQPLD